MAKTALAFSVMPDSPIEKILEWTKDAEEMGYAAAFMTEANNDSLACSLALGMQTKRIGLGTAITNIYLRHPALLANEAATVHQFTGGRFILGLGTGHGEGNSRLGIEMGQPMVKMRETVATLRKMLEGGGTGPKISGKLPLYLAGVSRPMVRMAGEIADGVIFNFFPPARVHRSARRNRRGRAGGRAQPGRGRADAVRDRVHRGRSRGGAPSGAHAALAVRGAAFLRQHDGQGGFRAGDSGDSRGARRAAPRRSPR